MITITKQTALIVIDTPERLIYQGVQDFAFGFDVQHNEDIDEDIATYYQLFYAPITEFNIDGVQVTDLETFEAQIEAITS